MNISKIDKWKTVFKSRLLSATSVLLVSSVLAGCGAGNASKVQDDQSSAQSTANDSAADESLEEKIKNVNKDQLEKAAQFYKDELNIENSQYDQQYTIEDKSVDEEVNEAYLNGNKNYQCTIVFKVSTNGGRDAHWYNLKVIIENDIQDDEVKPLGYTATEYGLKYGAEDAVHWIALDKNSPLAEPVSYGSEEHKAAGDNSGNNSANNGADNSNDKYAGSESDSNNKDGSTGSSKDNNNDSSNNNSDNQWQYFNVKDGHVSLKGELSELPKSETQDAINELYAMKGYQFAEEPYKSRYPNGTITDVNQIQFTDEEKSILDRLTAYAES